MRLGPVSSRPKKISIPPTHPAARLSEREDARQQTTQRNGKMPRQKGESQRRCTECHELRQCQEARGEDHKNSTSSSDHRTTAVKAGHLAELGSPTFPRNEQRVRLGPVTSRPTKIITIYIFFGIFFHIFFVYIFFYIFHYIIF